MWTEQNSSTRKSDDWDWWALEEVSMRADHSVCVCVCICELQMTGLGRKMMMRRNTRAIKKGHNNMPLIYG